MSLVKSELKAKDVMTADPVCVSPTSGIGDLVRALDHHEISGMPVVNEAGRVVGEVSRTDLIRWCIERADMLPADLLGILSDEREGDVWNAGGSEPVGRVEDFMVEDPLMVGPDLSAAAVARLMHDNRIHRVIVADDDLYPVGIITSMDLLAAFSR